MEHNPYFCGVNIITLKQKIMKKYLFMLLAMLPITMFTACSSDDGEDDIKFTLSQKSVELFYKEETEIIVNGVDADDCNIKTSDDFITNAYSHGEKIRINGNHVGNAVVTISYKDKSIEVPVVVKPVVNYIGMPIINFGAAISSIKEKETAKPNGTYGNKIDYVDQTLQYSVYHRYYFSDDKLTSVLSTIDISKLEKGYGTFFIQVTNSLRERYSYLTAYKGVYQTIYMFTFKNKYYIGARDAGGNGGWYIFYAPTIEEIKEKLDIHPSIAI